MKVNKIVDEDILVESGDSKGDNFEIGAAEWLNNNFSKKTGYTFHAKQDTGHGDIECIYKGDVKFLVECKLGPAQAGQMSLKPVFNDNSEIIKFDYKRDENTLLGKLTSQILNLINTKIKETGSAVEANGIVIDNIFVDDEGDISAEADITEDSNLFQRFVKQEYLDNKPSTKFFIFDKLNGKNPPEFYRSASNINPHLCLTKDIDRVYDMSAKARLKVDADALKYATVDDKLKKAFIKAFNAKDIVDIDGVAYALLDKKLTVNDNYKVTVGDDTYHLNQENGKLVTTDNGIAQQIRKRKKNNRVIFIITLNLTKEGYSINQTDEFIKYLNSYKNGKNEELDMRENLSEELKINDVIELDDGDRSEEEIKEDDKEESDLEKDIQKELDDKNKIADEIRDAEAPKPELNNGLGKATKIKQFVEKLILEEPSNILNEDFEDEYSDARFDAVHAVFKPLTDYAFILQNKLGFDADAVEEELYSVAEEAIIRFMDEDDRE